MCLRMREFYPPLFPTITTPDKTQNADSLDYVLDSFVTLKRITQQKPLNEKRFVSLTVLKVQV